MINIEIYIKYSQFCNLISNKRIKEAIDLLSSITNQFQINKYNFTIESYYETYKNILKYSFELVEDPEKDKIYNKLIKSLLELADEIKEVILSQNQQLTYYRQKENIKHLIEMTEDDSEKLIDKFTFSKEIENILKDTGTKPDNKNQYEEKDLIIIFNLILFTNKINNAELKLIKNIIQSEIIPWYDKSLLVSALTLSIHRYFDADKIHLLFDFYNQNEEQVWQRALVGIFTCLIIYENRIQYYPEIIFKLQELCDNNQFIKDLENIILQFIRSKETEKITKKLREEIIPEMMKYRSELVDKLDLDKIIGETQIEDKNPEWETVFKDSPGLYDKMEEFSKLQMEGADVFISAFSMLKHFSFFNQFPNWFIPFHKENYEIIKSIESLEDPENSKKLIEGLEKSVFLCNSDKYSFCLNISFLPISQKKMISNLFNMELKTMNELTEDEGIINKSAKNKAIFTQYIQDLYRFYKLHPLKNEFIDIFDYQIININSLLFSNIILNNTMLRNIGEFYFEKNYYNEALTIFRNIKDKEANFEVLEKTGFCLQQLGKYKEAIEYYKKAELFDSNKLWVLKKIAFCYKMDGNFKDSIMFFKEAEKNNADDLYIQAYLGHCYMDLEDYETALKYYYKVEYLAPDNHKIQRPIAWCSFLIGKYNAAKKYFEKVIKKEENKNDYLNLGHVEWCLENKKEAINNYLNAAKKSNNDFQWFDNEFNNDSKYLIKNGINEIDIPLMLDFIKINSKK